MYPRLPKTGAGLILPTQVKPGALPRINWSHPLTRGLTHYYYDTGDTYVNLVFDEPITTLGVPTSSPGICPLGPCQTWLGTQDTCYYVSTIDTRLRNTSAVANPPVCGLGPEGFSMSCQFYQTSYGPANSTGTLDEYGIFERVHKDGNADADSLNWWGIDYYRISAASGEWPISFGDSNATINRWNAALNTPSTVPAIHTCTGWMSSATAGGAYGDAADLATTPIVFNAYAPWLSGDNTDYIVLGNKTRSVQSNNSDKPFPGGNIPWAAIWNRKLLFQEHLMLHFDPYCFLEPAFESYTPTVARVPWQATATLNVVGTQVTIATWYSAGVIVNQALSDFSADWQGLTLRQRWGPELLPTAPTGQIKVRFEFALGTSGSLDAAYVGHAAASGDPYDFDGNQAQLLFSGAASVAVSGVQTIESDLVSFNYDSTKALIVSAQFSGTRVNLAGFGP